MLEADKRQQIKYRVRDIALRTLNSFVPTTPGSNEVFVMGVRVADHNRKTSTAGFAKYSGSIEMNLLLCIDETRYFDTLVHEWAHIIAYKVFGNEGRGHGSKWKEVMVAMGAVPKRCHNYSVAAAMPDKYEKVMCPCGVGQLMSKRRVAKIRKGVKYLCVVCKTPLSV